MQVHPRRLAWRATAIIMWRDSADLSDSRHYFLNKIDILRDYWRESRFAPMLARTRALRRPTRAFAERVASLAQPGCARVVRRMTM